MHYRECPTCGGLPIDVIGGLCNACRMEGATYRPTNVDMVVDAMTRSRFGTLAEVFIMEAIHRLADEVSKLPLDTTLYEMEKAKDGKVRVNIGIDPNAWIGVAKEIKGKLTACDCGPCGL